MARLVKNVCVDRVWYGPAYGNADQVPDDVAAQITNLAAWEGEEGQSSAGEAATEQQADDSPSRPARNDSKDSWVDYAVSQGMNREDAEAMTKAALVTLYSDQD